MAHNADLGQLKSQHHWIYTFRKGKNYPGSAGLGLNEYFLFDSLQ